MQYNAFIEAVQSHEDGVGTRSAARRLTDAFFDTLGERLEHPARDHVAAQLPHDLKEILGRRHSVEHFTLEEFYKRLGARAGLHYEQAIEKTHIVTDVLRRAIPESEISFLLEQLPGEYIELFGPPHGPLSPSAPAGRP
jgi:uncharacterized protein (DUF2267 family)